MTKNFLITLIIITHGFLSLAQNEEITSDNYYGFRDSLTTESPFESISTAWLSRSEVVPIILEELNRSGFEWNFVYKLYKLENGQYIILDVYCEKDNFGFVYKTGHYAIPEAKHRRDTIDYSISYNNQDGSSSGNIEVELPNNIYLLNENWYWYKYISNKEEDHTFVDRAAIINILRNDIREILAKYKDLEKAYEENKWKAITPNNPFSRVMFVDHYAKFIDGKAGLDSYIENSIKYPEKAYKQGIEGTIFVEYTISETGEVKEVNIMEGGNKLLEQEAIRVIENMPKWKPAVQKGEPISMKYIQKFVFEL
jgi:TonB family protein